MRWPAERVWFFVCLILGRLLRFARYSSTRIVRQDGGPRIRKHRRFYGPLLVWLSGPLLRTLDAGVRILPQREWEERERLIWRSLHGASIRIDADGGLVLPLLRGTTLAMVLDDEKLEESVRRRATELAAVALARFHARGFTHGDAMAENVMIDLEAGVAHWFDFETVHESNRAIPWRRADDLRALLATCLVRTVPAHRAETLELILDLYADEGVTRILTTSFTPALRPSLIFHLGQAGLSFRTLGETGGLLRERLGA